MKRNLIVRIVAIFLCALMVLSVITAALYSFAADASATPSPDTGSGSVVWVIAAVAVAVIAIAVCLIMPKMKKDK